MESVYIWLTKYPVLISYNPRPLPSPLNENHNATCQAQVCQVAPCGTFGTLGMGPMLEHGPFYPKEQETKSLTPKANAAIKKSNWVRRVRRVIQNVIIV